MDAEFTAVALFFFALGCAVGKIMRGTAAAGEIEKQVVARTTAMASTYEAQSKFIADISHELQTPIAILRGNVEILEHHVAPEAKASLRVITATLDSMARLVSSILESARLKFSKNKFHKTDVVVGALLEEVYEDCFILGEDRGVRLSCSSEAEVVVMGDKEKLKEVLFNLISNALKHTQPGGTISLFGKKSAAHAEIIVEDTGCGISPENLPNIFERFYRIDSSGITGTGIGLHICRQIVEAHDGTITVESELGAGSRFTVRIPLKDLV
jgi:signal transduction histidine kinase